MSSRAAIGILALALGACGGGGGGAGSPSSPSSPGAPGAVAKIEGCDVFPADNPWNRDVSGDPVDPRSDAYIASIGASRFLHPDFGSDPTYGIPWTTVPGSQSRVPMSFDYADESDPGPYPFPPNAPIEAGRRPPRAGRATGTRASSTRPSTRHYVGPGWRCGSGAIFDLRTNALRPDGWTSADAAGLPILPGLVRHDEVQSRARSATRCASPRARTQRAYVHPATHFASDSTDADLPPMGLRVRLKASFDIDALPRRFPSGPRRAQASYGMFVADNGSDWFISGETEHPLGRRRPEPAEERSRERLRGGASWARSGARGRRQDGPDAVHCRLLP